MEIQQLIFDMDFSDLCHYLENLGEPPYRASQIWQGLYQSLWNKVEEFYVLPQSLRKQLLDDFMLSSLQPVNSIQSEIGETQKTQFRLIDGYSMEAVLMGYHKRRTLCISTQSGCPIGCVFCATGQMGFRRNLSSGEIIEQVLYYARYLKEIGERVTNVVLMGMGEPFLNYEGVMSAIDRLNHPKGFNLGARRFTISTVGVTPAIKRFTDEGRQINLAVSLHAAENELRSSLLPINRKYPLDGLIDTCRYYVSKTNRRITFEWALIQDVNDQIEHAFQLAKLVHGILCHVNVIPLNPTRRYSGKATSFERAQLFQKELRRNGIPCTVRLRRGIDIEAGCGQLALETQVDLNN